MVIHRAGRGGAKNARWDRFSDSGVLVLVVDTLVGTLQRPYHS